MWAAIFDELQAEAEKEGNESGKTFEYQELASAAVVHRDIARAMTVIGRMPEGRERSPAEGFLVDALLADKRFSDAKNVIRAWGRHGTRWLFVIAGAEATSGELASAKETLSEAHRGCSDIVEQRLRSAVLGEIAAAQARRGDVSAAVATARQITDSGSRVSALIVVAREQLEQNQSSARVTLAELTNEVVPSVDTDERFSLLEAIAWAQLAAKDVTAARTTLSAMESIVARTSPPEVGYAAMAKVAAGTGDIEGAKRALELSLASRKDGLNARDLVEVYSAIAKAECAAGGSASEDRILISWVSEAVSDPHLRAKVYLSLATSTSR